MHKWISPDTYSCSLCKLTHGFFGAKEEWDSFLRSFGEEVRVMYRDAFIEEFGDITGSFPIVARWKNDILERILSSEDIEGVRDLDELLSLLKKTIQEKSPTEE